MAPICTPLKRELGFDWSANEPAKAVGESEIPAATAAAEPINFRRENPLFDFEY